MTSGWVTILYRPCLTLPFIWRVGVAWVLAVSLNVYRRGGGDDSARIRILSTTCWMNFLLSASRWTEFPVGVGFWESLPYIFDRGVRLSFVVCSYLYGMIFFDVYWHINIKVLVSIIMPVKMDNPIQTINQVHTYFIIFFQCIDQMLQIFFANVLDPKFVHDQ